MTKIGRPKLVEQREIREKLQKFLPDVYKVYEEIFALPGRLDLKEKTAKEILSKLIPDLKQTEVSGTEGGPLEIKIVKDTTFGFTDDTGTTSSNTDTELPEAGGDI